MLAMPGTTVSAPNPNGPMPAACRVGSSGPRLCLLACVPTPSKMTRSSPRSGRERLPSAVCERSSDRWPYTGGPYVALHERADGPLPRTEAMPVDTTRGRRRGARSKGTASGVLATGNRPLFFSANFAGTQNSGRFRGFFLLHNASFVRTSLPRPQLSRCKSASLHVEERASRGPASNHRTPSPL